MLFNLSYGNLFDLSMKSNIYSFIRVLQVAHIVVYLISFVKFISIVSIQFNTMQMYRVCAKIFLFHSLLFFPSIVVIHYHYHSIYKQAFAFHHRYNKLNMCSHLNWQLMSLVLIRGIRAL